MEVYREPAENVKKRTVGKLGKAFTRARKRQVEWDDDCDSLPKCSHRVIILVIIMMKYLIIMTNHVVSGMSVVELGIDETFFYAENNYLLLQLPY